MLERKHLLKDPPSDTIEASDRFSINDWFTSKSYRVEVKSIEEKSKGQLKEEETQKIDNDRRIQIDATIVRMMKQCKTMEHTQSISEVRFSHLESSRNFSFRPSQGIDQLKNRFPIDPKLFNSRIQRLIELNYLSRSKDDTYVIFLRNGVHSCLLLRLFRRVYRYVN